MHCWSKIDVYNIVTSRFFIQFQRVFFKFTTMVNSSKNTVKIKFMSWSKKDVTVFLSLFSIRNNINSLDKCATTINHAPNHLFIICLFWRVYMSRNWSNRVPTLCDLAWLDVRGFIGKHMYTYVISMYICFCNYFAHFLHQCVIRMWNSCKFKLSL